MDISLDDVIKNFKPTTEKKSSERRAITIWVHPTDKALYDSVQDKSGQGFSKSLCELVTAAIRKAHAKAT